MLKNSLKFITTSYLAAILHKRSIAETVELFSSTRQTIRDLSLYSVIQILSDDEIQNLNQHQDSYIIYF